MKTMIRLLWHLTIGMGILMAMIPTKAVSADGPFPLQRYTLTNGMRVWVQPRADSESVAVMIVLRAGSRYETLANNGVSHFVEHMLFAGTERWSEEEIKNVITRRGGRWNGSTGVEMTSYYSQVSAQDFDLALDWLSQIVFHPTFPAEKIDKERGVIFEERMGRYGWIINQLDAWGLGYELTRDVRRALYPGSTLGLRIVGEDASLDSLDRAGLMDYYRAHYQPGNAVLVIAGNVSAEHALERAQALFGTLAPGPRPADPLTPPVPDQGPYRVVVRGPLPTDQSTLMLGAQTVGLLHPDRWPLRILAEILTEDLMKEIRYRQGLVYGVGAYNDMFEDTGYFVISAMSESGHRAAILSAIERHLDQIRRGEIDAARVAEAQAALKGRWALSMEDNVERADWLADWAVMLPDGAPIPDYAASIDAVTSADLARVVDTYFVPGRRFLGTHEPIATVASVAQAAGLAVAAVVGLWGGRKLWQRARSRRAVN